MAKKTGNGKKDGHAAARELDAKALVSSLDATLKSMYPKSYAMLTAPAADALRERLRAELPKAPDLLGELYAWRNGATSFLALGDDASAFDWLPLEQAFATREMLASRAELPDGWFPIFSSTDGAYLCLNHEGRLTYFDTQGEPPTIGYAKGSEHFERLEHAVAKTLENMKAERWRFGREPASDEEAAKIVATKKEKAVALLAKAAKATDVRACVRAHELAWEVLRVHKDPATAREIVKAALPLLPRGIPGASVREKFWSLELDACVALELEGEAATAAEEASSVSGRAMYIGQLGTWLFEKGAFAASADAFRKAAGGRNAGDPWLLKLACALMRAGDRESATSAANAALAALDATLQPLTAPHHGTARAAAWMRKAVGLTLLGDLDAGKRAFADALTHAEPSSALRAIKDDPVWRDITARLG